MTNQTLTDVTVGINHQHKVILVLVMVLSDGVILVGNLLVLIAVGMYEQLQTKVNALIVSLAVTDLLIAFELIFWISEVVKDRIYPIAFVEVRDFLAVWLTNASILHLCLIAAERYIAVLHPYKYDIFVTKAKLAFALWSVWFLALTEVSAMKIYLTVNDPTYLLTVIDTSLLFLFPMVLICAVYGLIWKIARKQVLQIHQQGRQIQHASRSILEMKATKMLAIVTLVFTFSWAPNFLMNLLSEKCVLCDTYDKLHLWVLWLGCCNSAANPLIYGALNSKFRRAFKKILLCGKG